MSEPSARERFVEASKRLIDLTFLMEARELFGSVNALKKQVRSQAEAFADVECGDYDGVYNHCRSGAHSTCHTALLKEVFGE